MPEGSSSICCSNGLQLRGREMGRRTALLAKSELAQPDWHPCIKHGLASCDRSPQRLLCTSHAAWGTPLECLCWSSASAGAGSEPLAPRRKVAMAARLAALASKARAAAEPAWTKARAETVKQYDALMSSNQQYVVKDKEAADKLLKQYVFTQLSK